VGGLAIADASYDLCMASDHEVIGKVGRLTGEIEAGHMGEVMIPIRGGTEAYFAFAADPEESIPRGARVIVIEHEPPRTVIVSRYA
jgi:hypothetical protein